MNMQIYRKCMGDIRTRLNALSWLLQEDPLTQGNSLLTMELAFLQLRRVLEIVAFSSLTAHERKYAEAYKNYHQHWRAKDMLKVVERLNPHFYPRPLEAPTVINGRWHYEVMKDGFLTRDEFGRAYDDCSLVLHTSNPFSKREPVSIMAPVDYGVKLKRLVERHYIRMVGGTTVWLVTIPSSGEVSVQKVVGQSDEPRAPAPV